MGRDNVIDRDKLKTFLEEARTLKRLYDEENKRHPESHYDSGSVDKIALRLLEDQKGFVVIGVKPQGNNVKILAKTGHLSADGQFLFVENGTIEYFLRDFGGTTVSTFAQSVSKVIDERVDHGILELREIMVPNAKSSSAITRREVGPYARQTTY